MSKLSGGQKVRLSIAFLVAVQRLIIPEVGLLILDEPSTHLDSAGVESLRELLMSLSTLLQNTNSQVWVVDHNPALQAALGACVNLEN
jgi:DNA repair exonuclease SbcCD ATPase subunit